MSSLLEDVDALPSRRGPLCSLSALRDTDPALADEIAEAVTKRTYAAVSRALKKRGVHIAAGTLARHHAGECSCR